MRKGMMLFIFLSHLLLLVGCSNQELKIPESAPEFVQVSDFENIDWQKKAVEFGENPILGNENKSGVIGADMPSLTTQKWMWHVWGVPSNAELTVMGFHRETQKIHSILNGNSWTLQLGGPNNGADAHSPSSVKIPEKGEWAVLLYIDQELFDTIIFEINH